MECRCCRWPVVLGIFVVCVLLAVIIGVVTFVVTRSTQMKIEKTIVNTTCGAIRGTYNARWDAFAFKGIPYAAPPTGNRRWKQPVPLRKTTGDTASPETCWKGMYKADTYGSQCPQIDPITYEYVGSEDCLFLNVFTPDPSPSKKLPVVVYIHGGYLLFFNASTYGYSPSERMAREFNAVFVSIQYRLNGLGFLVLEELGEDQTGNYGFWDQIEGLKWVRDNIKNFGGDPEMVTLLGHSSGGTSARALLAAPPAKGLFHRVWMTSGSPVMNKSLADAAKANRFFLNNTGCETEECLRNLSAEQVVNGVNPQWEFAVPDGSDLPTQGIYQFALVVIDGHLLPKPSFEMWDTKTGDYSDVPVVIGSMAQEVDFFPTPGEVIKNWTHEQYLSYVKSRLDTFGKNITTESLELYGDILKGGDAEYNFTTITSDVRVNCGTDVLAEKVSSGLSSSVYRYVGTLKPSSSVYPFGFPFGAEYALHTWDLYGIFDVMADFMKRKPTGTDRQFSTLMRENLMSFVKHGVPSDPKWLPFSNVTALIDERMHYTKRYHEEQCDFWLKNGFFGYSWIN